MICIYSALKGIWRKFIFLYFIIQKLKSEKCGKQKLLIFFVHDFVLWRTNNQRKLKPDDIFRSMPREVKFV